MSTELNIAGQPAGQEQISAEEAAARRMFDKSYPQARPAQAPKPAVDPREAAANAMFPSMAPGQQQATQGTDGDPFAALRVAPHADAGLPLGPHVAISLQQGAEASGMSADEAAEVGKQWAGVFQAHGVADTDVPHLIDAASLASKGVDEDTTARWRLEAVDRLASEYGGQENGARALEVARRYVQAHPALGRYLDQTRLGDHPAVVRSITALARRAQAAGKLE